MKISGIYKIQSIINPERTYIGSAIHISKRWKEHLRLLKKGKHHSKKLQSHFDKYGESDLVFIIIEPCLPEFLTIREDTYFKPLPFFNICPKAGSPLGMRHSEEAKEKNRKANSGKKYSDEVNKKKGSPGKANPMYGVRLSGKKNGMFGKHHSEESKQRIRETKKDIVFTDEWRKKLSDGQLRIGNKPPSPLGKKRSEETKKKMSKNNAMHRPEVVAKMLATKAKRIRLELTA